MNKQFMVQKRQVTKFDFLQSLAKSKIGKAEKSKTKCNRIERDREYFVD